MLCKTELLLLTVLSCIVRDTDSWRTTQDDETIYYLSDDMQTWSNARHVCDSVNAVLPGVTNTADFVRLQTVLVTSRDNDLVNKIWIGHHPNIPFRNVDSRGRRCALTLYDDLASTFECDESVQLHYICEKRNPCLDCVNGRCVYNFDLDTAVTITHCVIVNQVVQE